MPPNTELAEVGYEGESKSGDELEGTVASYPTEHRLVGSTTTRALEMALIVYYESFEQMFSLSFLA